ncbi:tRNA (adenosine(37)-N6)-threonylcarbamoyltransferase complex transferase subunit TsaD, partial [Streptococcus suis]
MKDRLILAIETSCDETSGAVLRNEAELLSNVIASQIAS